MHTVTIASGHNMIILPDGRLYNAGDIATLTDGEFVAIRQSLFDNGTLVDGGVVNGSESAVVVVSPTPPDDPSVVWVDSSS